MVALAAGDCGDNGQNEDEQDCNRIDGALRDEVRPAFKQRVGGVDEGKGCGKGEEPAVVTVVSPRFSSAPSPARTRAVPRPRTMEVRVAT